MAGSKGLGGRGPWSPPVRVTGDAKGLPIPPARVPRVPEGLPHTKSPTSTILQWVWPACPIWDMVPGDVVRGAEAGIWVGL